MPRIPRNLIKDQDRCYHIISRTTGQEFSLGDVEKEYLMQRIKTLSSVYFAKVFTFCILSNHFHLLVQMQKGEDYSEEEIERRFRIYYGPKRGFPTERMEYFRKKWSDISEYIKEIKHHDESPLAAYRKYVYEAGSVDHLQGRRMIPENIAQMERKGEYHVSKALMFRYRSRYFTESVVLGSKEFVRSVYRNLHLFLKTREDRAPFKVKGLEGIYSLRRLGEDAL